ITLLGDGAVGKTALVVQVRFFGRPSEVVAHDPTIEDVLRHSVMVDGEATSLEIVDTAGQEDYAVLRDEWIHQGEGFILVYSIASRRSYERIQTFRDSIIRTKGARAAFMLVGNKSDKEKDREVPRAEAQALSQQWGCSWMETSAKTSSNVVDMFNAIIRTLRANRDGD
ncbi:hypothetical protein BDV93DRAFT_397320, partial [Ceratobasidium sp. AG-I]